MTESLFSIGTFGRAAGLSPTTLRFYDEVGLLPAAHIDPTSGYRYYDRAQQDQARLLATLRELDVPVATMAELLDLDAPTRADRLLALAERAEVVGSARARTLRELARRQTEPEASGARTTAHASQAAEALRRIATLTGEAPFDDVLAVIADGRLAWFATDRFRLGRFAVRSAGEGDARLAVPAAGVPDLAALLDEAGDTADLTIRDGVLTVGDAVVPTAPADPFPDLPALHDTFVSDSGHRTPLARDGLEDAGGSVQVRAGEAVLTLTADLLHGAVASLVDGPVVLRHSDDPVRPTVLVSAAQPDHTVVLMPRSEQQEAGQAG